MPTIPAVDNTYGAYLLSTFVGILLQGTVFHQTYRYVKLFPKDPVYLKLWVASVFVAEVINTFLTMHASSIFLHGHEYLQSDDSDRETQRPPGALRPSWLRYSSGDAFGLLLLDVAFFACFLALDGLGASAKTGEEFFKHSYFSTIGAGLIGLGDLMVTSCLIYILRTSRTGIRSTNSQLDLLIRYAVGTGFLICVFNVLILAFSIKWPDNWIYTGLTTVITKMYANTLLVSLNARRSSVLSELEESDIRPEDFMGHFDTDIIGGIPSAAGLDHTTALQRISRRTSAPAHGTATTGGPMDTETTLSVYEHKQGCPSL